MARVVPAVVGLVAIVLTACACSPSADPAVNKTTATFAEAPGAQPNYIFPLTAVPYFNVEDLSQFQYLMYRPLYWFSTNGQVQLNTTLSLADPPVYSANGKSVTITLKGWKWSDGQPITARDIQFWQNLVTANKVNWGAYSPGDYPDNVLSTTISPTNPLQITFNLSQAYGTNFFTDNELSQITPLPQHVWDKESPTGAVGNYDETTAGAQAVYGFLNSESTSISTYDTNPLWQVVSGPWKLKSMDTAGNVAMVPNRGYGGPIKPTLTEFFEVPYTDDSTEFDEIKSAASVTNTTIDYGYVPDEDVSHKGSLSSVYNFEPWTGSQIMYLPENFTNPRSGPIFSQLYFRQAMQDLVDQKGLISQALRGYGYPDYGPVPTKPSLNFAVSFEQTNPYPYDPAAAKSLLEAHGWNVDVGGVSTCTKPGIGTGECGAGIATGAQASFTLQYASGSPSFDQEMTLLTSDFSQAGIEIDLTTAPFETIVGETEPCVAGSPCGWDIGSWGVGWIYQPDYYPTGEDLWSCSGSGASVAWGAADAGGYCDSKAEADILATQVTNDLAPMDTYENYLTREPPDIWMPVADMQLSEINKDLNGTNPQSPVFLINPENWRWS
jgi:peptide/nickel transport system substrate-binding protein